MTERFIQDMHTALASFAWKGSDPWPVVVLSDGSEPFDRIVGLLNGAGMAAQVGTDCPGHVKGHAENCDCEADICKFAQGESPACCFTQRRHHGTARQRHHYRHRRV